ncbi:hypothetical protein DY000_02054424 [Brassica cretica]|uniref:Uncharacterized protein n=1 Tax=Brassica cretica TaxID=69181 RepID=A0ABQ7AFW4_BRACR|nr:hypothetical protein DY000_02054424 [Brassica cretica]
MGDLTVKIAPSMVGQQRTRVRVHDAVELARSHDFQLKIFGVRTDVGRGGSRMILDGEAESGEFSRLERRRFGEFSEVTEESEFQNPAPVTKEINPSRSSDETNYGDLGMDMKMVDTKVVGRDEEMVVDTVEVEDGRVRGIQRWRWWLIHEWRLWWLWMR